jgi:antitoxin (DNA-binding transcriptional repressor) of toxin-antitoxin stability system
MRNQIGLRNMMVIDLEEAKLNLEKYARDCQSSPVIVTQGGRPVFELLPIRTEDPDVMDRLIATNPAFRRLLEERHNEVAQGKVSALEDVRQRLEKEGLRNLE